MRCAMRPLGSSAARGKRGETEGIDSSEGIVSSEEIVSEEEAFSSMDSAISASEWELEGLRDGVMLWDG